MGRLDQGTMNNPRINNLVKVITVNGLVCIYDLQGPYIPDVSGYILEVLEWTVDENENEAIKPNHNE